MEEDMNLADYILATILLLVGVGWCFMVALAAGMDPQGRGPTQTIGWGHVIAAPCCLLAGIAYWIGIIL
jgi:hypothetical protein